MTAAPQGTAGPRQGGGRGRVLRVAGSAVVVVGLVVALVVALLPRTPTATALTLSGDLAVHDPALVVGQDGAPWVVVSTGDERVAGGSPQVRTSPDGREWTVAGTLWESDDEPAWVADRVRGVKNYWAPEVYLHDGVYYVYWSASTFGSNTSVIGLHTGTTLDPDDPDYGWVDRGEVLASTSGDDFNAIDPGIVVDADGTPWMAFGSFWSGIRMVELSWPDGLRADLAAEPLRIADRGEPPNAVEAAFVVPHEGRYYLFVSFDSCCQGLMSTYRIAVGRAEEVTGPYLDRDGVPMLEGGGTVLLESDGPMVGPGGQSVSADHLAFHYYDERLGGGFQLAIHELAWVDGWPVARAG
ncbi:arabinan endo-1,5-alpha-L-arabinosidase [Actinotalea sp. K2]|uniref:arabinan endo-1,5-alpha-L-arabinosidase n=1 Tax=Actinotalea sp. K2 TaxID=2939438 RepID=UPI002017B9FB|nr:arabinan endo-1,5-alpha-L-arabinosidase [Actinotalea sp. K2]MCL3863064.1 arabinan endo-1,5-alpha-L-arabinosidase [Actinotalea sp. K2]